jgi:prevent-host-death family protein
MDIAVSDAKAHLTDLVRRAEAGEEVVLTRFGHAVARLVPVRATSSAANRRALMQAVMQSAKDHAVPGPDAARSQDFLYNEAGLPL